MYAFYSSVSRFLGVKTKSLKSIESHTSIHPSQNKEPETVYADIMLTPDFSKGMIISKNDEGETVIIEYPKHDKTFRDYRPKFFKYK